MANQMTITFNVENQILSRTDTNKIIEKSKNYLFAEFTFSEDWNNTNKAIIFENDVLRYKIYLDSNNKCQVPNRIIRNDGFTISVIGENSENLVTITTSELYIAVGKGIKSDEEMESIYEITSQSLDVNKNGGTCNLEIKDEEKFYYEMQENDFSNMQHESGNQWSLDLSETLENVITEFKKRIGVDWDRLGIQPPVPNMPKCVYTPTKKTITVGDEEITYYTLSAVDSYGDTSATFFYQNDSWHVIFITSNFVDSETFNLRMADKQDVLVEGEGITISGNEISTDRSKVVANPILVGDEPNLEGTEIDGIKYKVGGGNEVHLYKHSISFQTSTYKLFLEDIYNDSSVALTINGEIFTVINNSRNKLMCYCFDSGNTLSKITHIGHLFLSSGQVRAIIQEYNGSGEADISIPSNPNSFTDTVTQIF